MKILDNTFGLLLIVNRYKKNTSILSILIKSFHYDNVISLKKELIRHIEFPVLGHNGLSRNLFLLINLTDSFAGSLFCCASAFSN